MIEQLYATEHTYSPYDLTANMEGSMSYFNYYGNKYKGWVV